jgi:hypothetical protein
VTTIADLDQGAVAILGRDRLDRLADALGADRIRPGGPVPPLWHWVSLPPACSPATSLRVRFFHALQAGSPILLRPAASSAAAEVGQNATDIVQDNEARVQTLSSPLRDAGLAVALADTDEALVGAAVDIDALVRVFGADGGGQPACCVIALLAAHRFRHRPGGQLAAIQLNFCAPPGSLAQCRLAVQLDCQGRALFRIGVPREPVTLSGTAWFGCGPGGSQ